MVDLVSKHQNRLHLSGRRYPVDNGFDGMHTGKEALLSAECHRLKGIF